MDKQGRQVFSFSNKLTLGGDVTILSSFVSGLCWFIVGFKSPDVGDFVKFKTDDTLSEIFVVVDAFLWHVKDWFVSGPDEDCFGGGLYVLKADKVL